MIRSIPTVLSGSLQIILPQALPAPWPGSTTVASGMSSRSARLRRSASALSSTVMPPDARNPRSGRPMSPANRKSPEKKASGNPCSPTNSKLSASRVWPGVWRARKRSVPTVNSSPSRRNRTLAPAWNGPSEVHGAAGPIPLTRSVTGRVAPNARIPLTKSACRCVSATATIRTPSSAASRS